MKQDKNTRLSKIQKEIAEWAKIIAAAALIALVVNTCIIANSWVPSPSMENTIMTGDRIIASRLSYRFGKHPERGDIVIFDHQEEEGKEEKRLVKRIIGLPGETVEIKNNRIYIDRSREPLEEPYLAEKMVMWDCSFQIPQGCYIMLGDNRNKSKDARFWENPYVPEEAIIAKVKFRYFPEISAIH